MTNDTEVLNQESTVPKWNPPWRRDEEPKMAAVLSELRQRIHELEESERRNSAAIEAQRLEIVELKGMARDQKQKTDEVLAKLDLGFSTVTALLKGVRNSGDPFADFK